MSDYKFKVGDLVRGISADVDGCEMLIEEVTENGYHLTFTNVDNCKFPNDEMFQVGKTDKRGCFWEGRLELVTPHHTPITPKVGDRFRVVKGFNGHHVGGVVYWQDDEGTKDDCYMTTEYLEPVEEEVDTGTPFRVASLMFDQQAPIKHYVDDWIEPELNKIKQPITKTIMNRIKTALLSKADKTLIKAGFLNQDLELSQKGEEAMQFIAFEANKKALVEMAEADIKEVEDTK